MTTDGGALLPSEEASIADAVVEALRKKRKKKRRGPIERAGRWEIWRLPWDADPTVTFVFPRQPHVYRLVSATVHLGSIAVASVRPYLTVRDGADHAVAKVGGPDLTATPSDSVLTFSADLDRTVPILGGIPPWPYTQRLPMDLVILPTMRWELDLDTLDPAQSVRGVSVFLERLEN